MSLEAIKMITEAEQDAQRIRSDTQAQIRKIKADGELEGQRRVELALSRAREETGRAISDAEHKAEQHSSRIFEQARIECEAFKEKASGRIDKAVDHIVERIVVT